MTSVIPVMGPVTGPAMRNPFLGPADYEFNFANALPPGATLTRASTGRYFDSLGVLQSASTDAARFTYNPGTLALEGLLVEPAATDSNRNSSAVGAVAGVPGTAPTNWLVTSTANNVTREIVGAGTEDGIPYVDVRYSGTPSASAARIAIFEAPTQIAAVVGQTWTGSLNLRLVGGSLANTSVAAFVVEQNSGGAQLGFTGSGAIALTGAALKTQRTIVTRALSTVGTAYVTNQLHIAANNGLALNITVRIGLPQLVQAPVATSPIVTTVAAVTRAADVLTLALPDGTYDFDIARVSGVTNLTSMSVSGGAYTVPTDVSPLQSVIARRTA